MWFYISGTHIQTANHSSYPTADTNYNKWITSLCSDGQRLRGRHLSSTRQRERVKVWTLLGLAIDSRDSEAKSPLCDRLSKALPLVLLIHFLLPVLPHAIDSLYGSPLLLTCSEAMEGGNQWNTLIHHNPTARRFDLQIVPHVSGIDPLTVTLPQNFAAFDTCITSAFTLNSTLPDSPVSLLLSPLALY